MILRESVGIAVGALRANKLRSTLTLLGTIIGVMSVIAVVSFVEGLNRFVAQKLLAQGSNVFWVDKFGLITSQEQYDEARRRPDITLDDAAALDGLDHVAMVIAQDQTVMPVKFGTRSMNSVEVRGRGPGYEIVEDIRVDQGRNLSELDDTRRRMVCVLGAEVAEELFRGRDPIGQRIRIGPESYEVMGVSASKGRMLGQSQDRFVALPVRTFQKFKRERGSVGIAVKSRDQASLEAAQEEVRQVLRARRHLAPGKPDNFAIMTAETFLELYHNLTAGIFVLLIGVAGISLLVGGIVIMNIMLVSVTERTREIGVRKALGARRRDILTQFMVESTTLSLTGGLVGVLLGAVLALLIGAVSPLPAAIHVPSIFLGLLMSCMVGVFFGSYPAFRAARLDPIEALRYE